MISQRHVGIIYKQKVNFTHLSLCHLAASCSFWVSMQQLQAIKQLDLDTDQILCRNCGGLREILPVMHCDSLANDNARLEFYTGSVLVGLSPKIDPKIHSLISCMSIRCKLSSENKFENSVAAVKNANLGLAPNAVRSLVSTGKHRMGLQSPLVTPAAK